MPRASDDTVLTAIVERATPGPWKWYSLPRSGPCVTTDDHGTVAHPVTREDAVFISTFDPETVLALIKVVRAANGHEHIGGALGSPAFSRHYFNASNPNLDCRLCAALATALVALDVLDTTGAAP